MSKKKTTQSSQTLTTDQLRELSNKLLGTYMNIYGTARKMFGLKTEISDADWERMTKITGVFKCEQCNKWLDASERDRQMMVEMCTPCVYKLNGEIYDVE